MLSFYKSYPSACLRDEPVRYNVIFKTVMDRMESLAVFFSRRALHFARMRMQAF